MQRVTGRELQPARMADSGDTGVYREECGSDSSDAEPEKAPQLEAASGFKVDSALGFMVDSALGLGSEAELGSRLEPNAAERNTVGGTPAPQHCSGSSTEAREAALLGPTGQADAPKRRVLGLTGAQWRKVQAFVISNFMPISFSLAAALALAWPVPGLWLGSWKIGDVRVVQAINNFLVFLISGLTLDSRDFRYSLASSSTATV